MSQQDTPHDRVREYRPAPPWCGLERREGQPLASWISLGALVALVVLGVALRLRQYLFNRSLWLDEVSLALNLIRRDVLALLSKPLAYDQSAPPGFLVSVKATLAALGPSDLALRLIPFLAGVMLLFVAFVLARRELKSLAAQVTFVGLVALSPALIYYSSELKQYSSDALFALAILLAVSYRTTRYGTLILAAVGFVAIVCSLPAVLVAAPAALLILYEGIRRSAWRRVFAVGIAWISAAALHGAYYLQAGADRAGLAAKWGERGLFAPFPPNSVEDLLWYFHSFGSVPYLIFRQLGHASRVVGPEAYDVLGWALALGLLLAIVAVVVSRRWTAVVAAGALLTTFLAAALGLYPFSGRLLLFLVPLMLFVVAVAIDELCRVAGPIPAGIAALLLLGLVIPPAIQVAQSPIAASDMRGAARQVEGGFQDGDAIVVWLSYNDRLFKFYAGGLKSKGVPILRLNLDSEPDAVTEFVKKGGYKRVWFVSAHRTDWASALINKLAQRVPITFDWKARGTRVVLFDFAAAPAREN